MFASQLVRRGAHAARRFTTAHGLSHVDGDGTVPKMVDVGSKAVTERRALASCREARARGV